jgi:hypothetical protein
MLLELPDPCLLAVLHPCATDDYRSLFSAARAHSKLHQAALLVLHSIRMTATQQHQVEGVRLYLHKHGRHIDSLDLKGNESHPACLIDLPATLQLTSLQLSGLQVQLQLEDGFSGVLGAVARMTCLKQLRLEDCLVEDKEEPLSEAMNQLPATLSTSASANCPPTVFGPARIHVIR